MTTAEPTVFIVDDEPSVRESVQLLVQSEGWRAEAFASGHDFLSHPRVPSPGCLILDVVLPDFSGLQLQEFIADRAALPVIFMSGHGDVPTTVRAMKAGAVDFFTKPFRPDAFLAAIRNALDRSRAALCDAGHLRDLHASYASLSPREREVMALIAAGRLNKQVGGDLGISEITVKAHRGRMMRKMRAHSLPDLVRMADRLCAHPIRARELGR